MLHLLQVIVDGAAKPEKARYGGWIFAILIAVALFGAYRRYENRKKAGVTTPWYSDGTYWISILAILGIIGFWIWVASDY